MLTKEQAAAMADKLVAEGKTARRSTRGGRSRAITSSGAIPSYYRSTTLLALPPPQQMDLLAQARQTANRSRQAISAFLCWAALIALLVVPLWSIRNRSIVWLALVALTVVGIQIRILLVRLRLQDLLLENLEAKVEAGQLSQARGFNPALAIAVNGEPGTSDRARFRATRPASPTDTD